MKTVRIFSAVLIVSIIAASEPARGEGRSWSKLNPFASSTKPAKKRKKSVIDSVPLLDGRLLRPVSPPSSLSPISTLKKFNRGVKRIATKTWDVVTFADDEPEPKVVSRYSGWGAGGPGSGSRKPEKRSWFSSLFSSEPKEPMTPHEFLSQKRPEY